MFRSNLCLKGQLIKRYLFCRLKIQRHWVKEEIYLKRKVRCCLIWRYREWRKTSVWSRLVVSEDSLEIWAPKNVLQLQETDLFFSINTKVCACQFKIEVKLSIKLCGWLGNYIGKYKKSSGFQDIKDTQGKESLI